MSFQTFLKQERPKPPDYVRFLHLLLQAMSVHAPDGPEDDVARFRDELASLSKGLTEFTGSEEMLITIGSVVHLVGENNRRASAITKAHVSEMQTMLGMMSSTIAFLATSSKVGVGQLQSIEQHVEHASNIDDIRLFRVQLSECLTLVRNETVRLREESHKHIQMLQQSVENTVGKMRSLSAAVDPATGLGSRIEAEKVIATSLHEGAQATIALFLVDGLASINARFGRKVGDEILRMVALHLGQKLPQENQPFRWSGPAFIALIEMDQSSLTERQIKQIASTRLEKNIDAANRTVLLPISCSVVIEKIRPGQSADDLFHALDKFVASRTGESHDESH